MELIVGLVLLFAIWAGVASIKEEIRRTRRFFMAKVDDITLALQAGLDSVVQSITDEIARVEALIAAGGLSPDQEAALQAQVDRLAGIKATLDSERP
jgi:hypothetical protein